MGKYIAVDLGAESGREILGEIKSDHIAISEIHRFLKPPIEVYSHLFWDVLHIFSEILLPIYSFYFLSLYFCIDHHGDKTDLPSSLEQVAQLLNLSLSRYQCLYTWLLRVHQPVFCNI